MGNYIYAVDQNTIFINLFISSQIDAVLNNSKINFDLQADFPRDGKIKLTVNPQENGREFRVAIRKPSYSPTIVVKVNGKDAEYSFEKGYIYLTRNWNSNDEITVELDVSFRFVRCNPRVRDNLGKVCLMKGPWVYCLEEADNGEYLASINIDTSIEPKEFFDETLLGGMMCASLEGLRIDYSQAGTSLYGKAKAVYKEDTFKAIPYCCWNNRGKGEMLIWMREN
jgi:DUF1680 family protein